MATHPYHDGTFPDISAYAYDDFTEGFTDAQGVENRRLLWQHSGVDTTFEWVADGRLYPAIVDPVTPANDRPAFYGPDIDDANGQWVRAVIERASAFPIWNG